MTLENQNPPVHTVDTGTEPVSDTPEEKKEKDTQPPNDHSRIVEISLLSAGGALILGGAVTTIIASVWNKQLVEDAVLSDVKRIILDPQCVQDALKATNQEISDRVPEATLRLKQKEKEKEDLKKIRKEGI